MIAVVTHHTYLLPVFGFGTTGVTMFFTLSGFLITALLIEERDGSGRLDLRGFYMRRACRLLPALAVFVLVMVWRDGSWAALRDAGIVFAYVGNWAIIAGNHLGSFHHTWSLAVEEQFYLLWPLVIVGFARRPRLLAWITGLAISAAIAGRFIVWDGGAGYIRAYYGSDIRSDAILTGCLLALLMRRRPEAGSGRPILCIAGLAGLVALPIAAGNHPGMYAVVLPTLVPGLMAVAIYALVSGPVPGWLTSRALTTIGQRSYALYLWHYLCLALAWRLPLHPILQTIAGLGLAWMITCASWHLVEQPFMRRWGQRRQRRTTMAAAATPA